MTKARDLANASTALSAVSATELAFVDGVTSAIQTQMDAKASLTGTETLTNKTLTSPVLTTPTISTVNAKGDLLAGTADNTVDRLAVGNNGETLVADSAATTGLRYQSAYNGNGIINGGMDIWQRGTSVAFASPGVAYTADRWLGRHLGTNVTYSQQASGLTGIQYGLRVQRPVSTTGVNDQQIYYQFETADSYRFAGQTVTLSFYAKAGANFSGGSSLLGAGIYSGTGTNQNITSGAYTGQVTVANETKTLTTSYQRFSVTGTVGSTATQIAIIFGETPTGTAGANDWYEITGVQLELGSVATSFKRSAGGTLQGELAACQRYYYRWNPPATGTIAGIGWVESSTAAAIPVQFPVVMRTRPTALETSGTAGDYSVRTTGGTATTCSVAPTFTIATDIAAQSAYTVASGLTGGQAAGGRAIGTTGYLGWSAEL